MKNFPILFRLKENCCGCAACFAICPKGAIIMVEDDEGFIYPHLIESKCIMCYECLRICAFKAKKAI